jgi:fructosamine-3-kinase
MSAALTLLVLDAGKALAEYSGDPDEATRLPVASIDLSPHERVLPPGRRALAERFGVETPVLEVYVGGDEDADPMPILFVLEAPSPGWMPPANLAWRAWESLDRVSLPVALAPRIAEWLDEMAGHKSLPSLRAAWSRPGWLHRITRWLDATLAASGRARIGPVEQIRLWGISALLRVDTDRGAVWVKAAYPHFAAEPGITRFLAERFPAALPRVLGVNEEDAWLALEDLGAETVGERRGEAAGLAAVRLLVQMQHELAASPADILRAGGADRPLDRLADDLQDAFAKELWPVEWEQSPERRAHLVEQVRKDASELAALGMPATLVHGDFHSNNVAVVDGRPVIFDWTDGALGHPLVDFATWVGYIDDPETRQVHWQVWVEAWSDVAPASELAARYHQVLALGSAYQVVSYAAILRALEPAARKPLADGASDFATLLHGAVAAREDGA